MIHKRYYNQLLMIQALRVLNVEVLSGVDVSWESLLRHHTDEVLVECRGEVEVEERGRLSSKYEKVNWKNPDASTTTLVRNRRLEHR